MKKNVNRRDFIKKTGTYTAGIAAGGALLSKVSNAYAAVPAVNKSANYVSPNDRLNIAAVGVGGMGRRNLKQITGQNIVALCDVDWKYAKKCFEDYPKAAKYKDYRKMLERKDIDAVVIATTDHTHACIAAQAMRQGLHVFVQKPLTHSVYESRVLTNLANEYKVATQMGNQGNSGEGIRTVCEWIWDGAIGEINKVDTWTNRPIWPQGLERPEKSMRVPKTLDWDLFLGPAAHRPYHSAYTPWNWRGWWDFGTGALGDMACHIIDPAFKALKLEYPIAIEGTSSAINTESAPNAERVKYYFPKRKSLAKVGMPAVEITWTDGGILPIIPKEIKDGRELDRDGGVIFHGTKGTLVCGTYGRDPRLFIGGKEATQDYKAPKVLRRIETTHEMDWVRACKESPENRVEASSEFNYAGPLNEMVVMGVVAVRLQDLRRKLEWDGKNMKFTNIANDDEIRVITTDKFSVVDGDPKWDTQYKTFNAKETAEEYIKHTYREGWEL